MDGKIQRMQINKFLWYLQTIIKKPFYKKIGKETYFANAIFVLGRKRISIGNRTRIFPNCRFEAHNNGTICIKDDVSIGQNCHIILSNLQLVIGTGTTISANVFISNTNHSYAEISKSVLRQKQIVKLTTIGDFCFIGYGAIILPGTKLGTNCIVGAGSVLPGGVFPPYSVIVGNPGRIIKTFNLFTKKWEDYSK